MGANYGSSARHEPMTSSDVCSPVWPPTSEQNVQRVSLFDETLAVRCQPALMVPAAAPYRLVVLYAIPITRRPSSKYV